ncbi:VWA domain-containing protein, partial [bacterium]|nr:VWA domain-containing protein [bacterium]
PVARVVVTQTFTNPYTDTIEAVYVFPLPHEAAVTDLTMRLGERVIHGKIDRREAARRAYEAARDAGKVAALLEQERPNIFTQSVANILPGNDVEIVLEYVETLPYEGGAYEFAFPMVVGPRFLPPGGTGETAPASFRDDLRGDFAPRPAPGVPDAHRVAPPYLPPSVRSGHDIDVTLRWDAGVPIEGIDSPTHRLQTRRDGRRKATLQLHPADTIPNKDLVVRCRVAGDGPTSGVLGYRNDESGYLTLLLHPDAAPAATDVTPKEMIFVLDCSGSMSGEPMAAAKQLVRHALRNVNLHDTFQIIRFSSSASRFASEPIEATPENVRLGIAYIDQLSGGGGTMMIEGIKAALGFPDDPERLRLVMFLTDGYIGNDNEILAEVAKRIGNARLFSFGVGGSVNRFLLDGLAEEGRGEVQYFLPGGSVPREVGRFYDRIRNPYLTDIELTFEGVDVTGVTPRRLPDLFDGQPLAIHARYTGNGRGSVFVSGRIAGREWKQRIPLDLPGRNGGNPAVGSLWARARIAGLERELRLGRNADAEEEITNLGLEHRLVTRFTSFVAIEEQLVVSDGRPRTVEVPLPMPEGVSYEGVFGREREQAAGGTASAWGAAKSVHRGFASPAPSSLSEVDEDLSARSRQDRSVRAIESKLPREERPAALSAAIAVTAASRTLRAGDPLELTITVTNRGRHPVSIPAAIDLDAIRLRVIDAAWRESVLGKGKVGGATRSLAAGASATFTLRLAAKDAAFLARPGTFHLVLEGAVFGAADAARVTIRMVGTP